eukprot:5381027-Prorocentrum_lima.AAC.1
MAIEAINKSRTDRREREAVHEQRRAERRRLRDTNEQAAPKAASKARAKGRAKPATRTKASVETENKAQTEHQTQASDTVTKQPDILLLFEKCESGESVTGLSPAGGA